MKNIKQMAELKAAIASKPSPLARQGLVLKIPAPGQLHRTGMRGGSEWFYLVTEVNSAHCDVIPGSIDAIMAGPNDIVLPPTVLGSMVFLSLDLAATLPRAALGVGFAELDGDIFNRIIDSQKEYENGQRGNVKSFPFALSYISRHDPRIVYHKKMADFIKRKQAELRDVFFENPFILHPLWQLESVTLAAGDEKKNIRVKCAIDGRLEILVLEYSPDEKKVWVRIFSVASERTEALDGAAIIDAAEKTLAVIAGGSCEFIAPDGFDGAIAIRTTDGVTRTLTTMS